MTIDRIKAYGLTSFGKEIQDLNNEELYFSLVKALMEDIVPKWNNSVEKYKGKKRAYYFSQEYLMGRALSNNLINLNLESETKELLSKYNIDYNAIEEAEIDAGLGNGGLGRLAACFLDSAATHNIPLMGYGIRYEYGIFKQKFQKGFQIEEGDNWLGLGDPWSIRKDTDSVIVDFADESVLAIPYDTPIIGYGGESINTLRLWQAEAISDFNLEAFNEQNYPLAVQEKNNAEIINKVLYPNDDKTEGKILRLKQQYFFVSASLQDLIRKHLEIYNSLDNFHKLHGIQLNDTHPSIAIPEMMRILTREYNMGWEKAWNIVVNTFAYTNHTILQEALEQWPIDIYKSVVPHIYEVVEEIDKRLLVELQGKGIPKEEIRNYKIIEDNNVKSAYLSIYGTHSTNGVAKVHSDILAYKELNNWYKLYPGRFNNKTNGITQRRWLLKANPELSTFITELLDSDNWITNLDELKNLEKYSHDEKVLQEFLNIKQIKKVQLAEYIKAQENIEIDPNSIYDIQIKRIHEYKRQLLNAFHILDLYYRLKENPNMDMVNRTFIFGGKAAPGYFRAKGVIKYINEIKELINNDSQINGKIKIVFVTNYSVSYGEKLFAAADVSEQISTAGKEASGTGNMKFMLNGTPTIGTLDGANIEIVEEAGLENNFIFGMNVEDIVKIEDVYNPVRYYEEVEGLKRVVDTLIDGTFDDGGTGMFRELYESLLEGKSWHKADEYYLLKDFDSYRNAQNEVNKAFRDKTNWAKICWCNMANAGKFSSDRTIQEYAKEIWGIY
ncbi:MAG: glycogen/starch/alpha-glucan phosphorylase [Tissierellia bacterium]|nr:glycogen/starch/alpha-glucan phosphorylase [Tissierellia bacterium]